MNKSNNPFNFQMAFSKECTIPQRHLFSAGLSRAPPASHLWSGLTFDEMHLSSTHAVLFLCQQLSSLTPPYCCFHIYEFSAEIGIHDSCARCRKMRSLGNLCLSHIYCVLHACMPSFYTSSVIAAQQKKVNV